MLVTLRRLLASSPDSRDTLSMTHGTLDELDARIVTLFTREAGKVHAREPECRDDGPDDRDEQQTGEDAVERRLHAPARRSVYPS